MIELKRFTCFEKLKANSYLGEIKDLTSTNEFEFIDFIQQLKKAVQVNIKKDTECIQNINQNE